MIDEYDEAIGRTMSPDSAAAVDRTLETVRDSLERYIVVPRTKEDRNVSSVSVQITCQWQSYTENYTVSVQVSEAFK